MKKTNLFILALIGILLLNCSAYKEVANFPPSDQVFITSGDGDIQKPYTPVGQLIYINTGMRIPLPLFGLLPINDIDPDKELRNEIYSEIAQKGGDGLINMQITFEAPKNGFIGLFATGGYIFVTGTIIKR